ncbi:MAG: ComF family protein [Lachnospiraceae bacterium]|nr:ComF family protein [Lachnospiraceae bacterium]
MAQIAKKIWNLIYPPRCPLCGEIIKGNQKLACDNCYEELEYIDEPRCKCCSKAIAQEEAEYCYDCSRKEFYFESGVALWNYSSQMKQSLAMFKYHNRKEYGEFYGEEFVRMYGDALTNLEPDACIPVPVHWTRYIERGYNQAAVIANQIGKRLDIPVVDDLLIRTKKTIAQKQLDDKGRIQNLQGAFAVSEKWKRAECNMKRVVIIDDIYTTGSTINACAKALKQQGIKEVYFGVLCIGSGY